MMRGLAVLLGGSVILAAAAGQAGGEPRQATGAPAATAQRALLDQYCVACHSDSQRDIGRVPVSLESADVADVAADAELWEKVVRKLRAGVMPPAGRPRPDTRAYGGLASYLETALDGAAAAAPNPGRTEAFHRLNRTEYRNAIRDVLALDLDIDALLPADDASYGFDNIAGVLKMSPTLMERYLSAARSVSRLAVGAPLLGPNVDTFPLSVDSSQADRMEGLPFGTRGGTLIRYHFPRDGEYVIQARLTRRGEGGAGEQIPSFRESHDLEIILDGERLGVFTLAGVTPGERPRGTQYSQRSRGDLDADWHVRLPVPAGPREIAVAFLKKSSAEEETLRRRFLRHPNSERQEPYLASVTIRGPYDASGPGETPSRDRIFVCRPAFAADERGCARTILSTLARRAYRRPVTEADLELLLPFYDRGRTDGGFETGIQAALERLLASPSFLFRVERDPPTVAPNTVYRISNLELASRLSFFLWSSVPDDELLDAATRGELTDPAVLDRQVRRMLADTRSQALVRNFFDQWLHLRNLAGVTPDQETFPDFDESLREAFRRETELFLDSVLREDRSALDLLTADYTFVNERLALHYGIPNVKGSRFRRVTLANGARHGILGKGAILTVTSHPDRTSPVVRGKWILENILGTPPPEPPPNVPALEARNDAGRALTMRQAMEQHRANPACASCHRLMDPPGFALEQFDAVGRQRTVDHTFAPIDASGVLPDGSEFEGVNGLRAVLLQRSEAFVTTLTEKLLTYALGRGLEYYDAPAVRAVRGEAARHDYRFSSLILGIVNSRPFQMRRSES